MASVSASILACDEMRLGEQVTDADRFGADYFHVDVMDGEYVANMAYSPKTVRDLKRLTKLPVAVHLEVKNPDVIAPLFFGTGAEIITFQLDACHNPIHLLEQIRANGAKAGLGIGPAFDVSGIRHLMAHIDWLTLMSVEPGYGGQKFEKSVLDKIRFARELMNQYGYDIPIAVDGGIDETTGKQVKDAGADVLISGSWLFSGSIEDKIRRLKAL